MTSLLNAIEEWIRQGLIDSIMVSFVGMFDALNHQVGQTAVQVGMTPASLELQ